MNSHVLSPNETKDVYPLMNVDDLYGTLYSPGDGTIDPAGWATTLTRAAKNRGAQVAKTISELITLQISCIKTSIARCAFFWLSKIPC